MTTAEYLTTIFANDIARTRRAEADGYRCRRLARRHRAARRGASPGGCN